MTLQKKIFRALLFSIFITSSIILIITSIYEISRTIKREKEELILLTKNFNSYFNSIEQYIKQNNNKVIYSNDFVFLFGQNKILKNFSIISIKKSINELINKNEFIKNIFINVNNKPNYIFGKIDNNIDLSKNYYINKNEIHYILKNKIAIIENVNYITIIDLGNLYKKFLISNNLPLDSQLMIKKNENYICYNPEKDIIKKKLQILNVSEFLI
ncbi:hypothetical protein HNP65_001486 [Thermosipho japonicus]|uniref:Uncharacterized protein n=1 Tax=Thermosipho japonicus TaxID=90323 RepID=A0A841GSL2_9BACT|nr:hypothetical protein [Thermosipho japonicus]MBB6063023.1 hypothetical protein [Thermosipho japonicus]